jgi:phosphate transport system substrate-binding protein
MRKHKLLGVAAVALAFVLLGAACSSGGGGGGAGSNFSGVPLTGAGATFPEPVYDQWFHDFQSVESGAQVNYQAIGSGGGIEQFTAKTVDFGASDLPLQSDSLAALPAPAVEIPTVLGGVVIAYNVNGLKSGLKLDGKTAADIFLGNVKTWNDPEIAALNPGVNLPNEPIQVVHRSDESGTTFVFTSWLAGESPGWKSQVGADAAVQWPTGTGGDGNDGVAAAVGQTEGSVGYLSYDFAVTSGFGIAQIKRDDGTYVAPSVQAISAAGGGLHFPITQDTSILNSSAPGAYPISTTTYLLINPAWTDKGKGQTMVDFLYWALTKGQDMTQSVNYSPLPDLIRQQTLSLLSQIQYQGKTIEPSPAVKR